MGNAPVDREKLGRGLISKFDRAANARFSKYATYEFGNGAVDE